ncbi:MAG: class I fructose-bisphosphate aldolase [Candidatus Woesearchaeota archaeon]
MRNNIFRNGKTMILAYDQGFEHGPVDFNKKNVDPQYIFDIAIEGGYDAIAVQAGIAKHYYKGSNTRVPLVVKLNAKTRFDNKDPISKQHTSVKHAASLGAVGVGYTIYLGSSHEQEMFKEFAKICEEAHDYGLTAICWMYPRGKSIKDEFDKKTLAYGARIAMELGADIVKLKYNGSMEDTKWVVDSAGKCKVVIAGGNKVDEAEFLNMVKEVLSAGAVGLAVGRNVWQSDRPLALSRELMRLLHP